MKPWLCKAGETLRGQINDAYPDRDKTSDGWIGDARHSSRKSNHNPDADSDNVVRAIDIDKDLANPKLDYAADLADQLRLCAKKDGRIAYVIFRGKIASPRLGWRFRPYKGLNAHEHHIHISFTPKGDKDATPFKIPLLGE